MPARISTIGFSVLRIRISAISDMYTAEATPSGTANKIAPAVTTREPVRRGKMPNCGGSLVGYHFVPAKNSNGENLSNSRIPSLKRKRQMRVTAATDASPTTSRIDSIIQSFVLRFIISIAFHPLLHIFLYLAGIYPTSSMTAAPSSERI